MSIPYYQVLVTPLKNINTYGTQIDITEYVLNSNFGKIKKQIDFGNYDIGIYTYSDLAISVVNFDGKFNDETDSASYFYFTRDRAKVKIIYVDESATENTLYEGLINDQATTQNLEKDEVTFRVLSLDSIFNKIKISGGLINGGNSFSTAIKAILNRPGVTSVLGYDESKVNVAYDGAVDDPIPFSEKDSRTVLEQLLNASGSVFYIDSDNDMVVKNRSISATPVLNLYGSGDPFQRDNIVKIDKYNNGLQRTFNTITINDTTSTEDIYVDRYGIGLKTYKFDFIQNAVTDKNIADYYLNQFKVPKRELEVTVKSEVAKDANILDSVTIDSRKRYKPYFTNKIPLAGSSVAGSEKVPHSLGGLVITPNIIFKIIGIEYDIKTLLTVLKLREV